MRWATHNWKTFAKKTVVSSQVCLNSWAICFNIDLITYGATIKWMIIFFCYFICFNQGFNQTSRHLHLTIFHHMFSQKIYQITQKKSFLFFYCLFFEKKIYCIKKVVKIYSLTKLSGIKKFYIAQLYFHEKNYSNI